MEDNGKPKFEKVKNVLIGKLRLGKSAPQSNGSLRDVRMELSSRSWNTERMNVFRDNVSSMAGHCI